MRATGGQTTIYTADLGAAQAFYEALGLEQSFRYPADGQASHVELRAGDYVLALATEAAARADHGLDPHPGGGGIEIVLWVNDTDAAYALAINNGARALSAPKIWLDRLRVAWVYDLDGNPLNFVQNL